MMRSLIAIAALVASSYASSNELEGKGIICKTQVNVGIKDYISPVTGTVYRGYRFIEGRRVNESLVRKSGLGMEIGRLYEEGYEVDTYREDVYEVRWGDGQHSLNRRTLELTLTYSGPDNFNYNPKMAVSAKFPCEVYIDEASFEGAMAEYARLETELIKKAMGDNKI